MACVDTDLLIIILFILILEKCLFLFRLDKEMV